MKPKATAKNLRKRGGKQARGRLQTPTVRRANERAEAKTTRGIKVPDPELAELLRLMNLIPKGYEPLELENTASLAGLMDSISQLPDSLRMELLDYLNRPERWIQDWFPVTAPPDWLRRWFPDFSGLDGLSPKDLEALKIESTVRHYDAIRQARLNFRGLFEEKPIGHTFMIGVLGTTDENHKIRIVPIDPFMRATEGVDRRYLRQCPVCDKFFYARRFNSVVCDPKRTCADTYAKRQERKNAEERKRLAELTEKNTKTTRAKTAGKR